MRLAIDGGQPLVGELELPADKSILHRALMLAALAKGESRIDAHRPGADTLSTARVLAALGATITRDELGFTVDSPGARGLTAPRQPLDCGNSGTTMRLMTGLLAGLGLEATLVGDASLSRRPMGRVAKPLNALGASARCTATGEGAACAPLTLERGTFRGGEVALEVASAQVKSALLLAGVASGRAVTLVESAPTRDHTERLLTSLGVSLEVRRQAGRTMIGLPAGAASRPFRYTVPGDFSAAAFWLVAGSIVPGSDLLLRDVGVNPTRTGLLEVAEELRASIVVSGWTTQGAEPRASLRVRPAELSAVQAGDQPTRIDGATIPRIIDELVVLAAMASRARGRVVVADARELRAKESDRIARTVELVRAFGGDAVAHEDGFEVRGGGGLRGAALEVGDDHRIALTAAVLGLAASGTTELGGFSIAEVSYPRFVDDLRRVGASVRATPGEPALDARGSPSR